MILEREGSNDIFKAQQYLRTKHGRKNVERWTKIENQFVHVVEMWIYFKFSFPTGVKSENLS